LRRMGQFEASEIVRADKKELFFYGDWCYNVPEWFPPVKKTWIESLPKLPSCDALGKITCYEGTIMDREMEWKAKCVEWTECESWDMRAITGFPARVNMHLAFRFESNGSDETRVYRHHGILSSISAHRTNHRPVFPSKRSKTADQTCPRRVECSG
jgi:hypothetical protein